MRLDPSWDKQSERIVGLSMAAVELDLDEHHELAAIYRQRAAALAEGLRHLSDLGCDARAGTNKGMNRGGNDLNTEHKIAGAHVVDWLLAYGWTPPDELGALLIDDNDHDEIGAGE